MSCGGKVHFVFLPDARRVNHFPVNGGAKIRLSTRTGVYLMNSGAFVRETSPDYVTMENVPLLARDSMFKRFVQTLETEGYSVDYGILYGPDFGLPQKRRRLFLSERWLLNRSYRRRRIPPMSM